MKPEEIESLISQYLHGAATAEQVAALSAAIESDPAVRQLYLRHARVHAALATLEPTVTAPTADVTDAPAWRFAFTAKTWAIAAGFAVLSIAIGAIWQRAQPASGPGDPVAHFVAVEDCRWVSPHVQVAAGDPIRVGGRLEISSGAAQIKFASGALVTLVGPAIFEVSSRNSGYLTLGQLKAVADTPESKGFTVQTRTARVVDVGTEFVAAVAADGQSRVDVTSGEVHVLLDGVHSPQRLRTGDALSVEAGQPQVMVRIESGDGTADFRFPTIEPPSSSDWADASHGRANIQLIRGTLHARGLIPSGPPELLLDGRGQSKADSPAESVYLNDNDSGWLLLDLGRKISIAKINTYSWHQNKVLENRVRAVQKFTLFGYTGDDVPRTDGELTQLGWVQVARVNSDDFFRVMQPIDRPAQQACTISGAQGALGRYRYLLWAVEPTKALKHPLFDNTFYAEFDVYGEP